MPHDMLESDRRCDDQALARCAAGSLSATEEPSVIAHLDGCPRCRTVLEGLVASPAEMAELRAILGDGAGADDDSEDGSGGEAVCRAGLVRSVSAFLRPSDDDAMLGRLGPYEIAGVIGSGGMGVVLKGWDRALDRFVAIKVLAPHLATSGAARKRFLREARAAAAVVHDNVIAIHGVAETDGIPYLVMPYCRGTTLEKRLRESGALEIREILRIGMQTARGLAAAHGQGLVHRDVKPANILLDDGVERVLLTDFGLARAADDASLTRTGTLAGTPHYMSPEQATGGQVDARSDLFALGAVLFTIATGTPPFRAESSHAVLRQVTDVEPADVRLANPDIPAWLAAVVRRLLAKDPTARFQSAAEVALMLEACLAHVNDPLATPLPADVARAAAALPSPTVSMNSRHSIPRSLFDSLRRLMNDQRLLSLTALVLLLMAILLPWPIGGIGRAESAIAFAVIASLASLLFAWLGRSDSLGRLVLKLAGGLAAIAVPLVAVVWLSFERSVALNREHVRAQAAQAEALKAQLVQVTRPDGSSQTIAVPLGGTPPLVAPAGTDGTLLVPLDQYNSSHVAPGPDPMPILTWPAPPTPRIAPSERAPQIQNTPAPIISTPTPNAVAPLAPIAVAPQAALPGPTTSPIAAPVRNALVVPPEPSMELPGGSFGGGLGDGAETKGRTDRLADIVEQLELWLAEHPQEAVAEVTVRDRGGMTVSEEMTIGPGAPLPTRLLELEDWDIDATTLQKECTTGFLGRSLAAVIRAGRFGNPRTNASTEIGVQTRIEDGDGYQQQLFLSGDPQNGTITSKELQVRDTLDGTFRTVVRTTAQDFREVAGGFHLPHRIEIAVFDIDFQRLEPENVIPKKSGSVKVVVKEWRPLAAAAPATEAEADVPAPAAEAASSVPPPMNVSGDLESPFEQMKTDLVDALDRIEHWLAEHPQEAVADVTVRHAGNQVSERMTIGPGRRFPSDYTVNWDQKEFTTGFVERSLAEVIRAGGRPAPPTHAATEIGVQTRLEDGDGFQQEMYISGDPKTGAVTTKELRGRGTLDGAFRTVVRTSADDFREVAPGIRLPHRIDIDTFDIDPNQPENAIPKKSNSLTIVVEEWRPLGGAGSAAGDVSEAENARSEMPAGVKPPGSSTPDEPAASTPDNPVPPADGTSSIGELEGVWELIRPAGSEPESPRIRIAFSESLYAYYVGETSEWVSNLTVDPRASPKRISFKDNKGTPTHGIYDVQGDGLRLSIAPASEPWPTRFGTEHPEFHRVTKEHPVFLQRLWKRALNWNLIRGEVD